MSAQKPPAQEGPVLELEQTKSEETVSELAARYAVEGVAGNAFVSMAYLARSNMTDPKAEHALRDMTRELRKSIEKTKAGGTDQADALLTSQASTLNSIFLECARRALDNMGHHLGATDTYLRLALKAQSQCRTTLESLNEIRNPRPVAFVKQANIAAGHQQVNNAVGPASPEPAARGRTKSRQSKLLDGKAYGNQLDTRTTSKACRGNPPLEAVGTVHRPKDRGGQGQG